MSFRAVRLRADGKMIPAHIDFEAGLVLWKYEETAPQKLSRDLSSREYIHGHLWYRAACDRLRVGR
mgnify:CR=1 FL=1